MRHATLVIALVLLSSTSVKAQLFGDRQFGQPLSRRIGASRFDNAGQVQGNERFLRGNRGAADFVGSDRGDQEAFVGSEQAMSPRAVVRSTAGLREQTDRSREVNQPLRGPAADGMYHPRLRPAFRLPTTGTTDLSMALTDQLMASNRFSHRCRFEVFVAERTAILRGEVTSARERDLAELVVLVEPGISAVKNELRMPGGLDPSLQQPPPLPEATLESR